ncbi:MAG: OFA family MFS transporter [Chloroflexota bacterium]
MSQTASKTTSSRWLVALGAVLIQLCLGAIYAWSVFTPYLVKAPFAFSKTQTQAVFSLGLATFAVMTIIAGRWMAKVGPRHVAITGGIILGIGYVLAGLVKGGLFGHFVNQLIFIGLVGGAGIGLGYVCPIATGMKWFPDKKGLITGLAVAGFGFGALIWVKLADNWGNLLATMGVSNVFILYGIIFAVVVLVGSIWMQNPPAGWAPAGWKPPAPPVAKNKKAAARRTEFEPGEMLRQPQFYMIWVMFIFSAMAGLMTIGNMKLFGIDALTQRGGLGEAQASAVAGTAMAVFYSLANGIGRILWGMVSDKIGRKIALIAMCSLQGVVMLVFFWMGANPILLYLAATLIGFNFGGNFALFPTMTSDLFGASTVGRNYGYVFTAYGVGGIVGPIMAASFGDAKNWLPALLISGVACLVAAGIGLTLKPPKTA